jgi:hypothetical protein
MRGEKLYIRANEEKPQVDVLFDKGLQRGVYCGFETLDPYYTLKRGVTTYLYGAPFSGKTELWLDILVTLSEIYGYHHFVYVPETGNAAEIIAELISKVARKHFYKQFPGHINEQEYHRHMDWVHEYFVILDPKDKSVSIEDFYQQAEAAQAEYGIKFDTTTCDPFNELKHNLKEEDGRQDLYIENKLGLIRRDAVKNNRHNAIITHCRDQQKEKTKGVDGKDKFYYPIPSAREVSGGQAWYRKAMNMICVWRPPAGVPDDNGQPMEENEVHVIIQKYKPKGTGKIGTVKLFYDVTMNRYYEKHDGSKRYAGKRLEKSNQFPY